MSHDQLTTALMKTGLSFYCATCEHYRAATLREGRLDAQCSPLIPCVGPLGGGAFPAYKGDFADKARFCFVCGGEALGVVRAMGSEDAVGCCTEHLEWLRKQTAVHDRHVEHATAQRSFVPVSALPRKKLLSDLLRDLDTDTDPDPDPK